MTIDIVSLVAALHSGMTRVETLTALEQLGVRDFAVRDNTVHFTMPLSVSVSFDKDGRHLSPNPFGLPASLPAWSKHFAGADPASDWTKIPAAEGVAEGVADEPAKGDEKDPEQFQMVKRPRRKKNRVGGDNDVVTAMNNLYSVAESNDNTTLFFCKNENDRGTCPIIDQGRPCGFRHRNPMTTAKILVFHSYKSLWKTKECTSERCPFSRMPMCCDHLHDGEEPGEIHPMLQELRDAVRHSKASGGGPSDQ